MTEPVDRDVMENALMGDLDSLRSTLRVVPASLPAPTLQRESPQTNPIIDDSARLEEEIPLLEDIVDQKDEPRQALEVPLGDQILSTLLDERWKHSYKEILGQARQKLIKARVNWSEEDAEKSVQFLLDNIEARFETQIKALVELSLKQQVDTLRENLLSTLKEELENISELAEYKDKDGPRH